jgi:hypothetical protein
MANISPTTPTAAQAIQGGGKFYAYDIEAGSAHEEVWAGQIIQSSTAGTAVLPTVTAVVGSSKISLPVVSSNKDWTVSKVATGRYLLTAKRNLSVVKSANACLQCASITGKTVQIGPISLSNQSIEFDVVTTSTGALVNLASGDSIHFRIEIANPGSTSLTTL